MMRLARNIISLHSNGALLMKNELLCGFFARSSSSCLKSSAFQQKNDLIVKPTSQYLGFRTLYGSKKSWFKRGKRAKNYDVVGVSELAAQGRPVPDHINKPDYAITGIVAERGSEIELKTEEQIQSMRRSCTLAKVILDEVGKQVQVGRTTDELDYIVHTLCSSYGAYPSPLNYRGYPKSICTSVNNIACHGIPDTRALKDGDIITIDVSVYYKGYHGDCAATFGVGDIDKDAQALMDVSLECLKKAISICAPGRPICDIGKTVTAVAEKNNFAVIPAFCGHGIGSYFHGPPSILHYVNDDYGVMQEGMVFTIEPVLCEGEPDIVVLEDGWTAATEDNSRSAQYEHTVLITKNGVEILTNSENVSLIEK